MKNEKITYVFALFLIVLLFVLSFYNKRKKQEEIENYDSKSIAYTKKILRGENSHSIKFYFYYMNNLYYSVQTLKDEEKHRSDIINDYFLVTFDKNNLKKNYIHLDKKIEPDSLTLISQGFKSIKYYEHDIATNTYIEHYKWQ